jgi:hypothetical protein
MPFKNEPQEVRIYKPNMKGNGAASKLQLRTKQKAVTSREGREINIDVVMIFWESAQQTGKDGNGNASFAWDDDSKKVAIKLGDADIAEILAVLSRQKDYAGPPPKAGASFPPGLFHKSPKGNSTFSLTRNENGGLNVRLSAQKQGQQGTIAVAHSITIGEGEIISTLLRAALVKKYGWN